MAPYSLVPGAVLASLLAFGTLVPTSAAADPLVRFDGGIGSQPLRAGVAGGVAAQVNDVFGVPPGGRPWVIERLKADFDTDGKAKVEGRGLLLGGGNGIGTAGNQSVRARLYCDGVPHDSELKPLDAHGDFTIGGFLNPIPPSPCNAPVLLIINANGSWFAGGIPKR